MAGPPANAAPRTNAFGLDVLEIVDLAGAPDGRITYSLDAPSTGPQPGRFAFAVQGWVLGRDAPAIAVELAHDGACIRRTPLWVLRPDVAIAFQDRASANKSGFRTTISLIGMPFDFELRLNAVLADATTVPMALIRGRHEPVRTEFSPLIEPLLLTSIARTGTTWLMRLLAEHPQILAHRAYPYETRVAGYWLDQLKKVTEPANPFDELRQTSYDGHPYTAGSNPMYFAGYNPYFSESAADLAGLRDWLENDYVLNSALRSQREIDGFYRRLAIEHRQDRAVYFVEKFLPNHIPWMVWQLYPQWREIFLVRDFRDVVCSVLHFSSVTASASFGREAAESDEAYIGGLFRESALGLLHAWQVRANRSHLVRYEDLVRRPAETLEPLLRYLGLDAGRATIAGMIERASTPTPELLQHRTTPDNEASIGRWRRDMHPWIQVLTEEFLGEVLRGFGYGES